MKPSEILHAAGDLLEQPGAWIQHSSARTAHRVNTVPFYKDAVCWCALGALSKVTDGWSHENLQGTDPCFIVEFLEKVVNVNYIPSWNDRLGQTQEEVVAAFRKAEQLALEAGQ